MTVTHSYSMLAKQSKWMARYGLIKLLHTGLPKVAFHLSRRTKVYFSGIQPTGVPHIGNYLGFIQNWVQLQEVNPAHDKLLSIADLHAITTGFLPPSEMKRNIIETAAALIASGVDQKKTVLFQQSQIAEHTQLAWVLGGLQTIASLQHIPHFKQKAARFPNGNIPLGLLCYPLLQAADVLLYKGDYVVVGEDQTQHIQILVHIANVFNLEFKTEYFSIPESVLSKYPRVKSLRDPLKKMSKSDLNQSAAIFLSDSNESVRRKCQRALSDSIPQIWFDQIERPAVANLILLHSYFSGKGTEEIAASCKNTSDLKESLFNEIEMRIGPIRRKYKELLTDEAYLWQIVKLGNDRAKEIAERNMNEIKHLVGFL